MTSYGLRSAQVHSMAKETLNAHWNTILPPDFQNVHFDWSVEKSRELRKLSTSSRVCITVSNSSNIPRVSIRLHKHGKRFLLLKWPLDRSIRPRTCDPRIKTILFLNDSEDTFFALGN